MSTASAGSIVGSAGSVPKPEGVTLGIGLTCPFPELAQVCAHAGFDVVLIDMEHGPISIETVCRMVMAVGTNAEAWIRVACNDAALIALALHSGAKEVMVPMVTTKVEAELHALVFEGAARRKQFYMPGVPGRPRRYGHHPESCQEEWPSKGLTPTTERSSRLNIRLPRAAAWLVPPDVALTRPRSHPNPTAMTLTERTSSWQKPSISSWWGPDRLER